MTMLDVFETIGKEFLASDGNVSEEEVKNFNIYITNLKQHIDEEEHKDENVPFPADEGRAVAPVHEPEENEPAEDLPSLLQELQGLVGLENVKSDVSTMINLLQIRGIRKKRGLPTMPMSLHMVFMGNPGTGKTTVARLIAKIYHAMGILTTGQLVEVDRSGLVGGYVGQTALKTQDVINKALGGVLFIDEAYSLTVGKGDSDFGQEAVDTILKAMEDHRDNLVVIVAGYTDLMNEFLTSNPGLRSRFNKFLYFEDYTPDELMSIFERICKTNGYECSEDCRETARAFWQERYDKRDKISFGNGRDVRNYFEKAISNQANRLATVQNLSDEQLLMIQKEDVENISL